MIKHGIKRSIYPDQNSWLSDVLSDFLKTFHNEHLLTLWDALTEYTAFHSPYCAYLGKEFKGELNLYPEVSYDQETKKVTLRKLYLLSDSAKTILSHDYLSVPNSSNNSTPFFNFLNKKTTEDVQDFPGLELMILHNNIEPSLAKELLLKTSYNRRALKKLFIFNNEARGIEYKSINITTILFDLSFLRESSFLNANRYASFKELLPDNLIVPIACKLDYPLPDIPKQLREQQLLDVSSIKN